MHRRTLWVVVTVLAVAGISCGETDGPGGDGGGGSTDPVLCCDTAYCQETYGSNAVCSLGLCRIVTPVACPNGSHAGISYVSEDALGCQLLDYTCAATDISFSDANAAGCGCGCAARSLAGGTCP